MARNIFVEHLAHTPIERQETEIVERKGIGHPDSVADGVAEAVSRALCQMYIERYGRILHHNTDEVQVVGGQSDPRFGGGVVLDPAYVLLVGRAVTQVDGHRLPYRHVAVQAAHDYIQSVCTNLHVDSETIIDCKIGQGSVDLRGLYETKKLLANDTSFGVSFAPYSETEKLALETEELINGPLKKKLPEVGQDVKVMACRSKGKIALTVAAAMVDRYIPDKDHYMSVKEELKDLILNLATRKTNREVTVEINTADNPKANIFYLTVTGVSFENGDDGSVGRGNRCNGLITPYRPMSLEATAGKNPVTHVGKLYNILAFELAQRIVDEARGDIEEVHVRIVSQIGQPISEPQAATAQLMLAEGTKLASVKGNVEGVIANGLDHIGNLTERIVKGKVRVF